MKRALSGGMCSTRPPLTPSACLVLVCCRPRTWTDGYSLAPPMHSCPSGIRPGRNASTRWGLSITGMQVGEGGPGVSVACTHCLEVIIKSRGDETSIAMAGRYIQWASAAVTDYYLPLTLPTCCWWWCCCCLCRWGAFGL